MENKIPLPTDSLYKFVALFSISLVIGAFYLTIYASTSTNDVVYEHWSELSVLQGTEKLTSEQSARKQMLERKIEIAVENRKTYVWLAAIIVVIGTIGVYVGFGLWIRHHQAVADQMAKNQLELSRLQLLALRQELKDKGVEVDTPHS